MLRQILLTGLGLSLSLVAQDEFQTTIRPVLMQHCGTCHNPANPKNRIDFLKSTTAEEINAHRSMWRDAAEQLRNRTMPPVASKLTEDDRLRISGWIDERLKATACSAGDFAGRVTVRRLNRREYRNTVRDLLGVDVPVSDIFPADGTGGEGFDTHGGTLYIPPMLMERYLQAAQTVLDQAIVTPPLNKNFDSWGMEPTMPATKNFRTLAAGEKLATSFNAFADGEYSIRVWINRPKDVPRTIKLSVDGNLAGTLLYQRDTAGGPTARGQNIRLGRGPHRIEVEVGDIGVEMFNVAVDQRVPEASPEKRIAHVRLFGTEPGESPAEPRRLAVRMISGFAEKAFRRPVDEPAIARYLTLYDKAAERGDPFEERVKLALKAILVSPQFLFLIENGSDKPGVYPLDQYELASRLSYFLWSTMPDEQLLRAAAAKKLQNPSVLSEQVDRMLDDPRSRRFASSFMGQWLGTKDIGGRVAPNITAVQHYYTPEVAADLREQPVLLLQHILGENRSLMELLTADYAFLTERLASFYQVQGQIAGLNGNEFRKVNWPDNRRAGVLGLAGVLMQGAHIQQSSPVLRGAWVLETLLGTHVPSPPPDVPPLETEASKENKLTMREKLMKHRESQACASCHNLMDPIGFGLENFDWLGRWRNEESGKPVDASGVMPTGEQFNGPVELRAVLFKRQDDFIRTFVGKVLGYALGRGLEDGDHCTIQKLTEALSEDGYRGRTLIREIALSVPFRNSQGGLAPAEIKVPVKRQKQLEFK